MAEWLKHTRAEVLYGENGTVTFAEHPSREFMVVQVTDKEGRSVTVHLDSMAIANSNVISSYTGLTVNEPEPLTDALNRAAAYANARQADFNLEAALLAAMRTAVKDEVARQFGLAKAAPAPVHASPDDIPS